MHGETDVPLAASGTGTGLIAFLEHLVERSEMSIGAGHTLKHACQRVLSVETDPSTLIIRGVDVDSLLIRFKNKYRGSTMTDSTVAAYAQRFRRAVRMYQSWLDGEDWRAKDSPEPKAARKPRGSRDQTAQGAPKTIGQRSSSVSPQYLDFRFPVRPGVQAFIRVPEDLTLGEVERIGSFLKTLPVTAGESI